MKLKPKEQNKTKINECDKDKNKNKKLGFVMPLKTKEGLFYMTRLYLKCLIDLIRLNKFIYFFAKITIYSKLKRKKIAPRFGRTQDLQLNH